MGRRNRTAEQDREQKNRQQSRTGRQRDKFTGYLTSEQDLEQSNKATGNLNTEHSRGRKGQNHWLVVNRAGKGDKGTDHRVRQGTKE